MHCDGVVKKHRTSNSMRCRHLPTIAFRTEGARCMGTTTATAAEIPLPKPEGLEGVVAASTALSHVFGEEGRLVYRGYDIHELAGKASFEEVAHLLWLGHLPTSSELADLQSRLEANRTLPQPV